MTPMTTQRIGIFELHDPPTDAVPVLRDAITTCTYPWERCRPELDDETDGRVIVRWAELEGGAYAVYRGATINRIDLSVNCPLFTLAFVFLHECGHMVDDTVLTDAQRRDLLVRWHADLDGPYDDHPWFTSWSHKAAHEHTEYNSGWSVRGATYQLRPSESFADAFVACFAPHLFRTKRFAHWSDDLDTVRAIILRPPPPPAPAFPNDSITRLYRAFFRRDPDLTGYRYWSELLPTTTIVTIADQFATSPEFRTTYGALTDAGFVERVYRNVLDRAPDPAGRAHWISVLQRGFSRGFVMAQFSESPEFVAAQR